MVVFEATNCETNEVHKGNVKYIANALCVDYTTVYSAADKDRLIVGNWKIKRKWPDKFSERNKNTTCAICGKAFDYQEGKITCSGECGRAYSRKREQEERRKPLPMRKKVVPEQSLAEVEAEAREMHKSYGKLYEWKYAQEQREQRERAKYEKSNISN